MKWFKIFRSKYDMMEENNKMSMVYNILLCTSFFF